MRPDDDSKPYTEVPTAMTKWGPNGHPFLRFLKMGDTPLAPEMVLDDVMQAGQVVLTGPRGCGKSTIAITIALLAAHLCRADHPLRPKLRRDVVYIGEDVQQAMLTATAIARRHGAAAGFTIDDVREHIRFVQATRLWAEDIGDAFDDLVALSVENESPMTGRRFSARPLVILDTRNATIEVEDENDNAEASQALSILRAKFNVPTLLVAHPAKSNAGSTRGAGAWEADAQQVIYVSVDARTRARTVHLTADAERDAKRRFETDFDYLHVTTDVVTFEAIDPLGETVDLRVRFCELMPEAASVRKVRADDADTLRVLAAVLDGAGSANKVADALGGNKQRIIDLVRDAKSAGLLFDENDGAANSPKRRLCVTEAGIAWLAARRGA